MKTIESNLNGTEIYESVKRMCQGKGGKDYVGPEPSKGLKKFMKRTNLAAKWSEWYGKHENRVVKKSYSDEGGNL